MNDDLSRQANVWSMNLESGDKYTNRKWKNYYEAEGYGPQFPPLYGVYEEGSVFGCLVDMDRGLVHFYKDGMDLGPAFSDPELKTYELYPFIQVQQPGIRVQIFHPFVHPLYREPPSEESMMRRERVKRLEEEKIEHEKEQKRKRKQRKKEGRDPDVSTELSIL